MDENEGSGEPSAQAPRKKKLSPIEISTLTLLAVSGIGSLIVLGFKGPSTRKGMHNPILGVIELMLGIFGAIGLAGIMVWAPSEPWLNEEGQLSMVGFWLTAATYLIVYCVAIASTVFSYFIAPPEFLQSFVSRYWLWAIVPLAALVFIAPIIWIIQIVYQAITQAKSIRETGQKSHEP
jgi:hypothetical protein